MNIKSVFFTLLLAYGLLLSNISFADPAATHGMAVFGEKSLYFSHLPMFHPPHDYQALFSGSFDQTGRGAYLDPKNNPLGTFYTMAPEPFVLPGLVSEIKNGSVSKLAQLFTGVFDENGTAISPEFSATFAKVLYFRKLNPSEGHPPHPGYLVLGNPDSEIFIVHLIHAPPDFDQIVKVNSVDPSLANLLRKNGTCQISIDSMDGDHPVAPDSVVNVSATEKIELGSQVYFNSEDLAH
jgi:hypothetical protein